MSRWSSTNRSADLADEHFTDWIGQALIDTVTVESLGKVQALLKDASAAAGISTPWRQLNHPSRRGTDWPVLYRAVRLKPDTPPGAPARTLVFGRDLRSTEALQLRLIGAQQAMERDYWKFREAETRYRHVFQTSSEALLIVDATSLKVLESNAAAQALLGKGVASGKAGTALLSALVDARAARTLQGAVETARSGRAAEPVNLELADGAGRVQLMLSSFRQEELLLLLVLLARNGAGTAAPSTPSRGAMVLDFVQHSPDALVFTDPNGRVLQANAAFLALTQLGHPDQARGELLDRWLGRTGVEMNVLLHNLRQRGTVRLFNTLLRGADGSSTEIELSASVTPNQDPAVFAFALRDIGRRLNGETRANGELPRSASELSELVGRVPLKDIVGETTDLIEQLCIETALQLTSDNRASAAQMLGLSRQSLYVKLRRYGIGDLSADPD
jgi:transcriptional regulator PpsR